MKFENSGIDSERGIEEVDEPKAKENEREGYLGLLTDEHLEKLKNALKSDDLKMEDLDFVDPETMEEACSALSASGGSMAEEKALRYIVELVRLGLG